MRVNQNRPRRERHHFNLDIIQQRGACCDQPPAFGNAVAIGVDEHIALKILNLLLRLIQCVVLVAFYFLWVPVRSLLHRRMMRRQFVDHARVIAHFD